MTKKPTIFTLFIITAGILVAVLFANKKSFKFYSSSNKTNTLLSIADYIEEATWVDNKLKIVVLNTVNCGVAKQKGEVAITGQQITLKIIPNKAKVYYKCEDVKRSVFEIPNLKRKDYQITFKHQESNDDMQIRADGSVSDACDAEQSLECYERQKNSSPPASNRIKQAHIITYKTEEIQKIAAQYPKFEEYLIRRGENVGNFEGFRIAYNEEKGILSAEELSLESEQPFATWIANGRTPETAIQNFIETEQKEFQEHSLLKNLEAKLNLPIRQIQDTAGFRFDYNGEMIEYQYNTIEFLNRREHWKFAFKNRKYDMFNVSRAEIDEVIALAEKAYTLLKQDGRFDRILTPRFSGISDGLHILIDIANQEASFETYVEAPHNINSPALRIHGRNIPMENLIQKQFYLNLVTGEIRSL